MWEGYIQSSLRAHQAWEAFNGVTAHSSFTNNLSSAAHKDGQLCSWCLWHRDWEC